MVESTSPVFWYRPHAGKHFEPIRARGMSEMITPEVMNAICQRLADGESLRAICADDAMPGRTTVFDHLAADEQFREQYARARESQAHAYADDIVAISDEPAETHEEIAHAKLRIDSRKWVASKLLPKKYGDATLLKHGDADGEPLSLGEASTRIATILADIADRSGGR